jgi:phosphoribosylformylglycinamidine (FGAM) synthase PurS component
MEIIMPSRIEITLSPELLDAEGEALRRKAKEYFDIQTESIRTIRIITIDANFDNAQLESARMEIFTNPVTQISSFNPLSLDFDWIIWVGLRPGVRKALR